METHVAVRAALTKTICLCSDGKGEHRACTSVADVMKWAKGRTGVVMEIVDIGAVETRA
jgi:hypothetical protein